MNRILTASFIATIIIVAACHSTKKVTTAAQPPEAKTESAAVLPTPPAPHSIDGIIEPGENELKAIQSTDADVTMQTLTDGHALYIGVCTNCHPAKSIYKRSVEEWPQIIDHMAVKAKITDAQKDAVYKYVMAIKATQPE